MDMIGGVKGYFCFWATLNFEVSARFDERVLVDKVVVDGGGEMEIFIGESMRRNDIFDVVVGERDGIRLQIAKDVRASGR